MPDKSFLDERYFVDERSYNCPFCNRRHVSYTINMCQTFDWEEDKPCHAYFARCQSCGKRSMHLSHHSIKVSRLDTGEWRFDLKGVTEALDALFFYSVPTSFFVLDRRVPRVLRELLTEAEGCLRSNFLTGASACARKLIYELAKHEGIEGGGYDDRIRLLKAKREDIDPTFFDTLLSIQEVTSSKVHENAYDRWEAKHIRLILASLREVLHQMYVAPALLADRRKEIMELQKEVLGKQVTSQNNDSA